MNNLFSKAYCDKRVLITGHTGFKGSWLSVWLSKLGAQVHGLAVDIPTSPSHFNRCCKSILESDLRVDVRQFDQVYRVIDELRPNYIFHLAAQSLVGNSYDDPSKTYTTNFVGSMNILEAMRKIGRSCTVVMITSDKCYENNEWPWGYRETDRLGGSDPYSSSKAATELMIRAYVRSFFSSNDMDIKIGVGRAGNVIGGGDWAKDRILPDLMRSCLKGEKLIVRNPRSTRPWQHVLEPLSGYLMLGATLSKSSHCQGEAFNFGPQNVVPSQTVGDIIGEIAKKWDKIEYSFVTDTNNRKPESGLLKLNCDKAVECLNWRPVLTFDETIDFVVRWYKDYVVSPNEDTGFTSQQIELYSELANNRNIKWAI